MNDKKIRKLVLAALLAALVCVATMVVQIFFISLQRYCPI